MDKAKAILFAILAAAFYAVNVPLSKLLLQHVGPTTMAALLYLGAGIGIGLLSLVGKQEKGEKLGHSDLPYVVGMIVLDIAAPILLMLGINYGTSSNASLLGNFEIVATTVIALVVFREAVSRSSASASIPSPQEKPPTIPLWPPSRPVTVISIRPTPTATSAA